MSEAPDYEALADRLVRRAYKHSTASGSHRRTLEWEAAVALGQAARQAQALQDYVDEVAYNRWVERFTQVLGDRR